VAMFSSAVAAALTDTGCNQAFGTVRQTIELLLKALKRALIHASLDIECIYIYIHTEYN
jgi:hypothetical protein